MKGYLLDTHTLLWGLMEPEKLSKTCARILSLEADQCWVSAVNFCEIAQKQRVGKLDYPEELLRSLPERCLRQGWRSLDLTSLHCIQAGLYPSPHRDPFDRLLAAQSELEQLDLLSVDPMLDSFAIRRLW